MCVKFRLHLYTTFFPLRSRGGRPHLAIWLRLLLLSASPSQWIGMLHLHGFRPRGPKEKRTAPPPSIGRDATVATVWAQWAERKRTAFPPLYRGDYAALTRVHAPGGQQKNGQHPPLLLGERCCPLVQTWCSTACVFSPRRGLRSVFRLARRPREELGSLDLGLVEHNGNAFPPVRDATTGGCLGVQDFFGQWPLWLFV